MYRGELKSNINHRVIRDTVYELQGNMKLSQP